MTAQNYFDSYQGQSMLYAPSPAREYLRGQCVQSVCFYVANNDAPVLWVEGACEWWDAAAKYPDKYERIANTATAVPQAGDIIIWDAALAGSGGFGHIAVCLYALPGTGTFVSVDQNWGGKTVHKVTHNYSHVIGWLRIRSSAPAPAAVVASAPVAAPSQVQGDEMISNNDQALKAYKMLRPNGGASDDEIAATAGKRSFAQFVNDAQGEVNQRDANLRDQAQRLAEMQGTINSTNVTITELRSTISNNEISNAEKQAALDAALAKIAQDNTTMTSLHDEVADLQATLADPLKTAQATIQNAADLAKEKAGASSGLIVAVFKFLLSLKLTSIFPKLKK
jgi:hypothetical protein